MRILRFLVRAFAFVQWLTAIALGVGCVVFQAQALEEQGSAPAPGGFGELLAGIEPLVVSLGITVPGLLVSILLMLSAIYCDRAAGTARQP